MQKECRQGGPQLLEHPVTLQGPHLHQVTTCSHHALPARVNLDQINWVASASHDYGFGKMRAAVFAMTIGNCAEGAEPQLETGLVISPQGRDCLQELCNLSHQYMCIQETMQHVRLHQQSQIKCRHK